MDIRVWLRIRIIVYIIASLWIYSDERTTNEKKKKKCRHYIHYLIKKSSIFPLFGASVRASWCRFFMNLLNDEWHVLAWTGMDQKTAQPKKKSLNFSPENDMNLWTNCLKSHECYVIINLNWKSDWNIWWMINDQNSQKM